MHKSILINEEVSRARDVMHKEKQCAGLTPAELHKSVSLLIILLVLYSHREWVFLALISEITPEKHSHTGRGLTRGSVEGENFTSILPLLCRQIWTLSDTFTLSKPGAVAKHVFLHPT